MCDAAIWVEASRLRRNTKVSLWLRYFQRIGLDAARITMEGHLGELARAREFGLAHGQISAAVQAEHYRGKAAGLYEDRLKLSSGMSDFELLKAIEELFDEETAEAISVGLNGDLAWRAA